MPRGAACTSPRSSSTSSCRRRADPCAWTAAGSGCRSATRGRRARWSTASATPARPAPSPPPPDAQVAREHADGQGMPTMTAELGRLEDAIFRLTCELDQAHAATDEHRALLAEACDLRMALEADLRRQRMTAQIRARLLADIF